MGKYTVHLIISIIIIIIILVSFPLMVNLDYFINDTSNSEAYVIAMSDLIYKDTEKKLSEIIKPLNLIKFNAVKGSELGSVVNERNILTIGALYDITIPENRRTHAELGSKNAIGCYLSHTALWTKLIDSDKDGYFIFESDAVCKVNIPKTLLEFMSLKKDFDILFFGNFWLYTKENSKFKKINQRFYGMHAYYITKKGAEKCLKYAFPIEQQIDSYLSDLVLMSKKTGIVDDIFNFYTINVCSQNNTIGTSIQTKKVSCSV